LSSANRGGQRLRAQAIGQNIHTGWMQAAPGSTTVTYAPHTRAAYRMPTSRTIYRIAVGLFTRMRLRQARRQRASGTAHL
jgi:hypothetical protein